jgi:hypothetical protein
LAYALKLVDVVRLIARKNNIGACNQVAKKIHAENAKQTQQIKIDLTAFDLSCAQTTSVFKACDRSLQVRTFKWFRGDRGDLYERFSFQSVVVEAMMWASPGLDSISVYDPEYRTISCKLKFGVRPW